jgi:DSF synthase
MNAVTESLNLFNQSFTQLATRFDADAATMWTYMNPAPRPCYNPTLLHEIRSFQGMLESTQGRILHAGEFHQLKYLVVASMVPGVYNLGGDLATFKQLIQAQERDQLFAYARTCIDTLWSCINRFNSDITLVALIQGQAMGGGLEGALPSDVIIAEKSSKLGLPEVLFNLFPGMGALSLLSRKVGMKTAEEIIYSGKTYTADEMAALGVVDLVVPDGEGEKAVHDWITRHSRTAHARRLVQKAKSHVNPVTYEELIEVTRVWTDGAMKLSLRDLRIMDRLIAAQSRRSAAGESEERAAA